MQLEFHTPQVSNRPEDLRFVREKATSQSRNVVYGVFLEFRLKAKDQLKAINNNQRKLTLSAIYFRPIQSRVL